MNGSDDNLTAWAALLQNRVTQLLGAKLEGQPDITGQAARLATAMNGLNSPGTPRVFTVTLQHWLEGTSAPATPELHESLMRVLLMPKNLDPSSPLAPFRDTMLQFYNDIPDACKVDIPTPTSYIRKAVAPPEKINGAKHPELDGHLHISRSDKIKDNPALPKRKLPGNSGYEYQDKHFLEWIMRETENSSEYLCCFRALMGKAHKQHWSQEKMAEEMAISPVLISRSELGHRLASKSYLAKLKSLWQQYRFAVPADYNRFEDLLIANRLSIINSSNVPHTIENQFSEMPTRYWKAALERCHGLDAWQTSLGSAKPHWVDSIRLIQNQGDYLSAMRHVFQLDFGDVASACDNISPDTVRSFENGGKATTGPVGVAIARFYEDPEKIRAVQKAAGITPEEGTHSLFNRAVYDGLEPTIWRHSAKRGEERAAKRSETQGRG